MPVRNENGKRTLNNLNSKKCFFLALPTVNGILSLLIVAHHCFTMDISFNAPTRNFAWALERYVYNISECAVPVFFFISAMLFYRDYQNRKEDYIKKIRRRITSLVVPYIIFNTMGYAKHILFGKGTLSVAGFVKSIWHSDTMPLWFIRELFLLCLLAPIIYNIKNRKVVVTGIICLAVFLVTAGIVPYRNCLYWLPIYMLGANFSPECFYKVRCAMMKCKYVYLVYVLGYLVLAWFLPNTTEKMEPIGNFVFYLFRFYSVAVWTLFIGFLMGRKSFKLGNYSFWIYCVHFPIVTLYRKLLNCLPPEKIDCVSAELFKFVSAVIVVYIVCIILGKLLQTYCSRFYQILNGGRL